MTTRRISARKRAQYRELVAAAYRARKHAHRPYSNFGVGAAVLTWEGRVYLGCNVENYGLTPTMHAEEVAVGSAIADGALTRALQAGLDQFRFIKAVAVYIPRSKAPWPCFGCRQLLSEFGRRMIIIGSGQAKPRRLRIKTLAQLTPHRFPIEDVVAKLNRKRGPRMAHHRRRAA